MFLVAYVFLFFPIDFRPRNERFADDKLYFKPKEQAAPLRVRPRPPTRHPIK